MKMVKNEKRKYVDILFLLIVNLLISTYFITSRIAQVSDTVPGVVIDLVSEESVEVSEIESETDTEQSEITVRRNGNNSWQGVQIIDDQQVWSTNTEVDVFKIRYENGESLVTANGDDECMAASGASDSYNFIVSNTSDAPVDYQMAVKVYFSDGEYTVPAMVRFTDKSGRYFAGSEGKWVSVTELNKVSDYEVLQSGSDNGYTLEWKLPYSENGGLKENTDITMTVVIHTKAMIDTELYAVQNDESEEAAAVSKGSSNFGFNLRTEVVTKPLFWCVLAVAVLVTGFRVFIKGKVK